MRVEPLFPLASERFLQKACVGTRGFSRLRLSKFMSTASYPLADMLGKETV